MMAAPSEVFFSFAAHDATTADGIRRCLVRNGIKVWFAPSDVHHGAAWQTIIGDALERCDWFLVLVTPRSVGRMWVQREVQYALRRNGLYKRITPIIEGQTDPTPLSWVLTLAQSVPLSNATCRRLVIDWGMSFVP